MTTTPETTIVFRRSGGHSHDGLTSSLIDTTKYSFFDFSPMLNGTANTARRRFQDNNRVLIKKFIVDTIEERVLNPQGIEIKANVITARNIAANTITADELSSNLVLVNNIIRSNSFNGTFYSNGAIATTGTVGWAIANSGAAVFNDVTIRGNITGGSSININNGVFTVNSSGTVGASSGTIGGWSLSTTSISAGSTTLYSNGHVVVASGTFSGSINASGTITAGLTQIGTNLRGVSDYAGIVLRNDSWENGFLRRSDGSVYFRAGGASDRYIYLDTASGISGSTNMISFPSFKVTYDGSITASSGTIGGFSLSSSVFSATSGSPIFGQYTYININSNGLIESFYQDIGIMSNFYEHVKINNYASGGSGAINVSGTAAGYGSTRWYTSYGVYNPSDIRLKDLIEEDVDALAMIKNVKTTKFIMKNDESKREQFGFIAQQINEHIPNVAIPGGENPETNPWGIVPEGLIPYLVKSVQQLVEKVESLESKGV